MDLHKVIRKLHDEREKLDRVIASLEQLQKTAAATEQMLPKKRRGRKFMDEEARREVSERMKRYWANRRKQEQREKA